MLLGWEGGRGSKDYTSLRLDSKDLAVAYERQCVIYLESLAVFRYVSCVPTVAHQAGISFFRSPSSFFSFYLSLVPNIYATLLVSNISVLFGLLAEVTNGSYRSLAHLFPWLTIYSRPIKKEIQVQQKSNPESQAEIDSGSARIKQPRHPPLPYHPSNATETSKIGHSFIEQKGYLPIRLSLPSENPPPSPYVLAGIDDTGVGRVGGYRRV